MSFESQIFTSRSYRHSKTSGAFVRFRIIKNGVGGGGSFSKATGFRGKKVDIQLDEELKKIRCKEAENGNQVGSNNGQFGITMHLVNVVGKERIALTLGDDGWWYGSYADKAND
jgi:hypothetical protein